MHKPERQLRGAREVPVEALRGTRKRRQRQRIFTGEAARVVETSDRMGTGSRGALLRTLKLRRITLRLDETMDEEGEEEVVAVDGEVWEMRVLEK